MTVVFSALYLVERLINISAKASILVYICIAILAIIAAFSVWSAALFLIKMIVQRFIPKSGIKSRFRRVLQYINDRIIVRGIASTLFGIDTTDTEGGEVIQASNDKSAATAMNEELVSHIEKLETLLERVLEKKETDIANQ